MIFRVSTSLCRFIFESPKVNDALLFMTILSTDLKALKRRGYNGASLILLFISLRWLTCLLVDRILRQQKAEREAAEKALKEARASLISNSSEVTVQDTQTKIPTTHTKIPSTPTGLAIAARSPAASTGTGGLEKMLKRPTSAINELGRFLRTNRSEASSHQPTSPPRSEDELPSSNPDPSNGVVSPPPNPNMPGGTSLSANRGPSRAIVRSPHQGSNITPLSNICTSSESDISGFVSFSVSPSQQYRHGHQSVRA